METNGNKPDPDASASRVAGLLAKLVSKQRLEKPEASAQIELMDAFRTLPGGDDVTVTKSPNGSTTIVTFYESTDFTPED